MIQRPGAACLPSLQQEIGVQEIGVGSYFEVMGNRKEDPPIIRQQLSHVAERLGIDLSSGGGAVPPGKMGRDITYWSLGVRSDPCLAQELKPGSAGMLTPAAGS